MTPVTPLPEAWTRALQAARERRLQASADGDGALLARLRRHWATADAGAHDASAPALLTRSTPSEPPAAVAPGRGLQALRALVRGMHETGGPEGTGPAGPAAPTGAAEDMAGGAGTPARPALQADATGIPTAPSGHASGPTGRPGHPGSPDTGPTRDPRALPADATPGAPGAHAGGRRPDPAGSTHPAPATHAPPARPALRTATVFARRFDRLRLDQRLDRARAAAPQKAGPLNSHALVLQALQTLQQRAPEHLQQFLAQVDALAALEQLLADAADGGPVTRRGARARR